MLAQTFKKRLRFKKKSWILIKKQRFFSIFTKILTKKNQTVPGQSTFPNFVRFSPKFTEVMFFLTHYLNGIIQILPQEADLLEEVIFRNSQDHYCR